MSFFASIGHFFSKMFSWLTPENEAKAQKIVTQAMSLLDQAMPIVQIVANFTGNVELPIVINALHVIGITAEQILDGTNKLQSDRAKQLLAMQMLRDKLITFVAQGGKIDSVNGVVLSTIDDVLGLSPQQLESAVSAAYAVFKGVGGNAGVKESK